MWKMSVATCLCMLLVGCSDGSSPDRVNPELEFIVVQPLQGTNGTTTVGWTDPQGAETLGTNAASIRVIEPTAEGQRETLSIVSTRQALPDGTVQYSFSGGRNATRISTRITDTEGHVVLHDCYAPAWACSKVDAW